VIPVLFAEVGETLIHFTDTALLGRVGKAELAAIGPIDAVLDTAIVPAVGLVEAMQILVARRVGQDLQGAIGPIFRRTLALVGMVATLVAAALWLAAGPAAERLIDSPGVAEAVEDFFRWGAWGIVFLALNLALGSLWTGLGRPRVLIGATAVLVLVNLLLTIFLIFGPPSLGIEGAGMGFLGAEIAAFAYLGVATARRLGLAELRPGRGMEAEDGPRGLVRLGTPIGLQALVEALRWVGFFLVIEQLGEDALAWSSLVYACYALFLIPSQAFAEALYTITSTSLGRDGAGRVVPLLKAVLWRALAFTLPLLVLGLIFPDAVLSVFTADPELIAGAQKTLIALILGMLAVVASELALAAVFGTGDTDAGFVIEVITSITLVTTAALVGLVAGLDLPYVWLALPLAAGVGAGMSLAWLRSGRWRRVWV
jgi:putative MATE family efflux protein